MTQDILLIAEPVVTIV